MDQATLFLKTGSEIIRCAPYAALVAERAWRELEDPDVALAILAKARHEAGSLPMVPEVFLWQQHLKGNGREPKPIGLPAPFDSLLADDWQTAADLWEKPNTPYFQAFALIGGDIESHYRAQAILETLGARATIGHVRKLMRSRFGRITHRGPRASTKANPAGLTIRQMDVLRHIEMGKSNIEIGDTLFVSAKTVDHHISAILGKLDARSRGEAVAIARAMQIL